jgi:hypothetical protein
MVTASTAIAADAIRREASDEARPDAIGFGYPRPGKRARHESIERTTHMSEFEHLEQEAAERGEQELNEKLGIGNQQDQGQGGDQSQAPDPNQDDQQDPGQN